MFAVILLLQGLFRLPCSSGHLGASQKQFLLGCSTAGFVPGSWQSQLPSTLPQQGGGCWVLKVHTERTKVHLLLQPIEGNGLPMQANYVEGPDLRQLSSVRPGDRGGVCGLSLVPSVPPRTAPRGNSGKGRWAQRLEFGLTLNMLAF